MPTFSILPWEGARIHNLALCNVQPAHKRANKLVKMHRLLEISVQFLELHQGLHAPTRSHNLATLSTRIALRQAFSPIIDN